MTRASYFSGGQDRLLDGRGHVEMSEKDTRKAWESFVTSDRPITSRSGGVRAEILQSWHRSKNMGIDAARDRSRKVLGEDEIYRLNKLNRQLINAASAAFQRLEPHLKEAGTILILADSRGIVIDAIGDTAVLEQGQDIHLEIGGDWNEKAIGTNGIGTALRTGKPAYVHASEHFAQGVQSWTCAGAPIRDPITGAIVGVVDLSGPPQIFRQHNVALVLAAAHEIEIALAEQQHEERTQLLEAFMMSDHERTSGGLLLLDQNGRIWFRRGLDETPLIEKKEFAVGHQLLPELLDLDVADLQGLLPRGVEAEGLEHLRLKGQSRGAALFLKAGNKASRARKPVTILPRSNVSEDPIEIIGSSPKMIEAIELAQRVAKTNVSVLIHGETGVGKELFARLIHSCLGDKDAPYVPMNCAAVSSDLIGAELFGYVDGAFTGAARGGRTGKFELAKGGVLCLDEIGDMPIELQPYFLRALEQKAIYRVGDSQRRPVDTRVIAMTNRDLRREIEEGNFRRDLFYRIGVVTISVPPLRERGQDILELVEGFSAVFAKEANRPLIKFSDEVLAIFMNYHWPGNVRELRNIVQRAYLVGDGLTVKTTDLPPEFLTDFEQPEDDSLAAILNGESGDLESIEASVIRRTMQAEKGNLTRVAATLGISRPTLYRKLKQYHIPRS